MTLLRFASLLALWGLSATAMAQTCPAGNPRVAPDSRYSITEPVAGQAVVTDLATGLMWKRCSEGQSGATCTGSATTHSWSAALGVATTSGHAGFTDWRLPSVEELFSLVETACHIPSINTQAFPATTFNSYWSSTSRSAPSAWNISFYDGSLVADFKFDGQHVRLVRGGQSFDDFASEQQLVPGDGTAPDAFTLTPQIPVPRTSVRTSDPITVAGLTTSTGIAVSGAAGSSYSINSTEFYTTQPGAVRNGDSVRVRHTSTAAYASPTTTTLTIGGVSADFVTHTANAVGLNDAAQSTCYNATASTGTVSTATPDPEAAGFNEQDCTRGAAAADALGRMAKVGAASAPGRDYSKIANDGSVLPASAALGTGPGDWGCTRDNVTGLIWEVKVDDATNPRHFNHTYAWYDANPAVNGGTAGTTGANATCNSTLPNCNTTAYRDAINALSGPARLCGASDWRLPTSDEWIGLMHEGVAGPAIDATWFPNTVSGSLYWSGENYAPNSTAAWCVFFFDGSIVVSDKSNDELRVLLVRGGQ